MPNIKVVIWSAAGAAVIAFIAGLFGRVVLLDLLLRTLVGGAAFGAFAAGLSLLLKRFIPEIFEAQEGEDEEFAVSSSESEGETAQAQQGSNLNIVLDGDEYGYPGQEEAGEAISAESPGYDEDEEFVEKVEESSGALSAEGQGEEYQSQPAGQYGDSAVSEYEEFEDLSDVDTLPDLDEFSDSFESVAAAQDSEEQTYGTGGYSSDESVDIMGNQEDPATVAKAVRTIIRKDQEG